MFRNQFLLVVTMSLVTWNRIIVRKQAIKGIITYVKNFQTSSDCLSSVVKLAVPIKESSHGLNFALSTETQALVQTAERFAKDEIIPKAAYYDATGEYPWDIVQKAHATGLMNLHVPQEYGGLGIGTFDAAVMVEKLAYGCCGIVQPIDANNLGAMPILLAGNHEQKKKYLSWLIEEPIVCSYGVTEPTAGSDVAGIKTKAVKKGIMALLNVYCKFLALCSSCLNALKFHIGDHF